MVKDWVVNTDTWAATDGAGQLPPSPGGLFDISGELGVFPLTFQRIQTAALGAQTVGVPELASRMLAVSVRGHIHVHLSAQQGSNLNDVWAQNWRGMVSARITRWGQEPDGQSIGSNLASYDLGDILSANDQYVWHHEKLLVNLASSDWLGTSGARAPLTFGWRVQANFKRTLEELECMAYCFQFQQMIAPADGQWDDVSGRVFVRHVAHLRTFVHAM